MIEKSIERALSYAKSHLGLKEEDVPYFRNLILHRFGLELPYEGEVEDEAIAELSLPDILVKELIQECMARGLDEGEAQREATWVLGILSPLPSEVNARFEELREKDPSLATDYLYSLSIANDYVAKSRIDKNEHWDAEYKDGPSLEISINLSKPEKNNKDIAKLKSAKPSGYPKCLLCKENLGFAGNERWPARENIRIIPMTLGGRKWYMQYSPYGYYEEHCIVFLDEHTPMNMCEENIEALLDFVDLFPHYFIGSNSDLPIVGGSILNHEHFQGGKHLLPLFHAKDREVVKKGDGLRISILDFYDSAISIKGKDKKKVLKFATKIVEEWERFNDPENDIYSFSDGERHATITPFVRKIDGEYQLIAILRNNRVDEKYPDGIFHAHPEYHHIKKEGIGLIEAAGLFILPARLKRQIYEVEEAVKNNLKEEDYLSLYPDLVDFKSMIEEMKEKGISAKEYINGVCQGILRNVAVFKEDEKGKRGWKRFLETVL